jgi:hypothetical protein
MGGLGLCVPKKQTQYNPYPETSYIESVNTRHPHTKPGKCKAKLQIIIPTYNHINGVDLINVDHEEEEEEEEEKEFDPDVPIPGSISWKVLCKKEEIKSNEKLISEVTSHFETTKIDTDINNPDKYEIIVLSWEAVNEILTLKCPWNMIPCVIWLKLDITKHLLKILRSDDSEKKKDVRTACTKCGKCVKCSNRDFIGMMEINLPMESRNIFIHFFACSQICFDVFLQSNETQK